LEKPSLYITGGFGPEFWRSTVASADRNWALRVFPVFFENPQLWESDGCFTLMAAFGSLFIKKTGCPVRGQALPIDALIKRRPV
jgi:hypothetical protein